MNKYNAKDYLPFIIALSEGKSLQWSNIFSAGAEGKKIKWFDDVYFDFTLPPDRYRIKPEPVVLWVNEYTDEDGKISYGGAFTNDIDAKRMQAIMDKSENVRLVKLVESND